MNEYGNTVPQCPDFGYADVGQITSSNKNPYEGKLNGVLRVPDVMDLAWAVDASGYPVSFPDGISLHQGADGKRHYQRRHR